MKKKNAFSLMEMMVVLLIVAIIAAASAPMINRKILTNASEKSPWVWTGLNNNITYNLNGSDTTATIGEINPPEAASNARMYIETNNDDIPHMAFGQNGQNIMKMLVGRGGIGITNIADADNVSNFSVVFGQNAKATQERSVSIGEGANTYGPYAVAIGDGSAAENTSVALGSFARARGQSATALGASTSANGDNATALGSAANAAGTNSIAIGSPGPLMTGGVGFWLNSRGDYSIAIGDKAMALENQAIALGSSANAGGTNSMALGSTATATGNYSVALGTTFGETQNKCEASGTQSIAIGPSAQATGDKSIAIGSHYFEGGSVDCQATSANSIAIGHGARAITNRLKPTDSIAIGSMVISSSTNSIAIGRTSSASANDTLALGRSAIVKHTNSVAIGCDASSSDANQITLGTTNDTVYIPGRLIVGNTSLLGVDVKDGSSSVWLRVGDAGESKKHGWIYDKKDLGFHLDGNHCEDKSYPPQSMRSDIRLKNVGKEFLGGLEQIRKIQVFNYTFKDDKSKTPRVGVMAQDLQKIFPDAVFKGEDGFLRIRMEDMFYALVNAVKELDKKVDIVIQKQKKIDELEDRVAKLEKRIADLEKANKKAK